MAKDINRGGLYVIFLLFSIVSAYYAGTKFGPERPVAPCTEDRKHAEVVHRLDQLIELQKLSLQFHVTQQGWLFDALHQRDPK